MCDYPATREDALEAIAGLSKLGNVTYVEGIKQRAVRIKELLTTPLVVPQSPQTCVSPTLPNVLRDTYKYFRALVWNLENFTNDSRPAGTKPIDSQRNQARSAIVSDLAYRIGADALLIMETGSDVGEAMTRLARSWQEKEANSDDFVKRSVEPLVSPATHGIPELPLKTQVSADSTDKIRALMLAGEGYRISPASFPNPLTPLHLANALKALATTSNNFQKFALHPPIGQDVWHTLLLWAEWCLSAIQHCDFSSAAPTDIDLLQTVLIDARNVGQFLSQPDTELGGLREAVLTARAVADGIDQPSLEAGVLETIELLLLAWILAKGMGTLDPNPRMKSPYPPDPYFGELPPVLLVSQLPLWTNGYGEPMDLVPICLLAGAGVPFNLNAHDPDNGASFTASDGELLINALIRLGVLPKPHSETYGVVYRPYTQTHLEHFLTKQFLDLGLNTSGIYGILHGDSTGTLLVSQKPKDVLAGRSALEIIFPVAPDLWIPFALHHNRYSGSKEISTMIKGNTAADNTVIARLATLDDEARLLAKQDAPPLIVGDFNVPDKFVQAVEKGWAKTKKKYAELRDKHNCEMGGAGYLRRRFGDETNPRTTLKRALSIAKGEGPYSEPYDAVYQPFDFLHGSVLVRSAAVTDPAAFFPPSVLTTVVNYAGEKNAPASAQIGSVLCLQVVATYTGIIRFIAGTLEDSQPWLSKHGDSLKLGDRFQGQVREGFVKWLWARRFKFANLIGSNLLQPIKIDIQNDYFGYLTEAVEEMRPYLKEEKKKEKKEKEKEKKKKTQPKKKTKKNKASVKAPNLNMDYSMGDVGGDDLLDDVPDFDDEEDDDVEEDAPATQPKGRKKKAAEARLAELDQLFTALKTLESDPVRRLLGAYGGVVSDHLPLLVEVEILV